MGVDVHILVRHDFYELDNYEKSMDFVQRAVDRVKRHFCIDGDYDQFELYGYYDDDNWSDIQFTLPIWDIPVHLHKGYWNIWTGCHTCQVSNKYCGRLHIADAAFDIAMALGATEAWYCDEFIADEGYLLTLDELLQLAEKKTGIAEYPYHEFMMYEDYQFPDFEPFYHDSFAALRNEYKQLCERCGEYKPIGTTHFGHGCVRVSKDGKINLAYRDSGKVVFDQDFDDITQICGVELSCKRNGRTALFDAHGNQLTDFVEGKFVRKYDSAGSPSDRFSRRYYLNHETQIRVMATYYKDGRTVYRTMPYKSMLVNRKPAKCPICKGRVVPIVYGEPTPEIGIKAKRGEVVLGGCIIYQGIPQWRCLECETDFLRRAEFI